MTRRIAAWALLLAGLSATATGAEKTFQSLSYDKAVAAAAKDGKLIFIDFYTTWCGPCKMLEQSTFKDPWVKDWLAGKAVALQVDAEKDVQLAEKFRVEAYPTLVFLNSEGKVLERQIGYIDAAEFRELAKDLDKGITALMRAERAATDHPDDPRARLALGSALVRAERYADARQALLWCLDEGAQRDPAFAAERDGRVLEELVNLAGYDGATLDSLIERRDAARRRLLDDRAEPADPALYVAVGQFTLDGEQLLATYDAVASRGAESAAAKALAKPLFPVLLEAKRYDTIAKSGDVDARIAEILRAGQAEVEAYRKADPKVDDETLAMLRADSVASAASYFQVLLGAGEPDAAKAAAKRILAFDASPDTYHALAWEGHLSGKPIPECLDFAQRALAKADGEERTNVVDTVARLMADLGKAQEGLDLCEKALADAKTDRQRWILSTCVADLKPSVGGH